MDGGGEAVSPRGSRNTRSRADRLSGPNKASRKVRAEKMIPDDGFDAVHARRSGLEPMSAAGTFRTSRDVRLESGMRTKADVRRPSCAPHAIAASGSNGPPINF